MPRVTMGFPEEQLGLPLFCAARNSKRWLLAASFAPAARRRMDRKLPCLRARTPSIRQPYTGVLQSRLRHRVSASSSGPRLGCSPLFGGPREPRTGHDLLCLRVRPRSHRTWQANVRPGNRGLAERTPGSASVQARGQLSPNLSRPTGRCVHLTIHAPPTDPAIVH